MATQATLHARKRPASKPAPTSPEDLLRSLVNQVGTDLCDSQPTGQESEEIIFDAVLDGTHYLLVRLPRAVRPRVQLSPREQEIVRMVAQGHPNKIIADVLCISSWTVCTHLRRIFAKLGVGSRAAMVARILENSNGREQGGAIPKATSPEKAVAAKAVVSMVQRSGG